jgi:hypothetical protein
VPEEIPEPSLTDLTDTPPAQGKPRYITRIFYNHYIYLCCALTLQKFYNTHMSLTSAGSCSCFA